jgi:hypothetical protein
MTKTIRLANNSLAIVDDEDLDKVVVHKWSLHRGRYASANVEGKTTLMHRFILNTAKGLEVDHIDGDGLNNVRANLRTCTRAQNARNRKTNINAPTPFKGVEPEPRKPNLRRPWGARITHNGKRIRLGMYATSEEAARAYDAAAKELHGEFARLNFPDE